MKLSILGILMLIASAVNAQDPQGCQHAAITALELKSIADESGQDEALIAWHSMRATQAPPQWHALPLNNLMEMRLEDITASEIRDIVLVACTLTFSQFASDAAKQLKNPPVTASR